MDVSIYGIKNCSTMKKAFDWLAANDIAFSFHDYRKIGIDTETLERWATRSCA
jgi:arsenate reductase-like glutaredoxin family protein